MCMCIAYVCISLFFLSNTIFCGFPPFVTTICISEVAVTTVSLHTEGHLNDFCLLLSVDDLRMSYKYETVSTGFMSKADVT